MRRILIFIWLVALVLLFALPASAEIVTGVALGLDVQDVKDPGFAFCTGTQQSIGERDVLRFTFNKLNYGNKLAIDNVGGMYIHYLGIAARFDVGSRSSADYEVDGDIGIAVGVEMLFRDIHFAWLDKLLPGQVNIYSYLDAVERNDIGKTYAQVGLGITFLQYGG